MMNKNYEFNPIQYGYEPIENYPELSYLFPLDGNWYIKVLVYSDMAGEGLVYWYSALFLNQGWDERIKILSGCHDTRIESSFEKQNRPTQDYLGLISNDTFAKQLLSHLFGTLENSSVATIGKKRLQQNIGSQMRKEFSQILR